MLRRQGRELSGQQRFFIIPGTSTDFFCSGEISQDTVTLSGASPPPLRHPSIAMATYYLQSNLGHRNAPRPPTGDWWRKRGAIFYMKKCFLQSKKFLPRIHRRSGFFNLTGKFMKFLSFPQK